MRRFPSGKWGGNTLEFWPAPQHAPFRPFAAMMFIWKDEEVLLCKIPGRGWCIPSGRVEPNEEPKQAAIRESYEEAGARLKNIRYLGAYRISSKREIKWAETFVGELDILEEIPVESEAEDRLFVSLSEIPNIYHIWNPLFEKLFPYSLEVLKR